MKRLYYWLRMEILKIPFSKMTREEQEYHCVNGIDFFNMNDSEQQLALDVTFAMLVRDGKLKKNEDNTFETIEGEN